MGCTRRNALLLLFIATFGSVCQLTSSDDPAPAAPGGPAPPSDGPAPPPELDVCGEPVTTPRSGQLVSHTRFTRCTYPPNLECQWDLESVPSDPDSRLEFSFDAYEMPREKQPCEQSYLRFLDGHNSNGQVIQSLCNGRSIPASFRSASNKVRVLFKAGKFPARGFSMKWKLVRLCRAGDFLCDNKECISPESKCDGGKGEFLRDCSDGSDEKNCPILSSCPTGEMLCDHRLKCYKQEFKCDGFKDCRDGSDEKNCPDATCDKNHQYICGHRKRCYNDTLRCNGKDDCRDNSDEKACTPKVCKTDEFRCNHTYNCTRMSYKCDGVNDCNDGSDEWNCKPVVCDPAKEFACANGKVCVDKEMQCDGKIDCRSDGSDEAGCKKVQSCPKGETQCGHHYKCVKISKVCDGVKDCSDNSDEDKCKSDGMTCLDTQFKCKRAVCIDKSERCDKRNDCMDNSDEKDCLYLDGSGPPCGLNYLWCPKRQKCLKATLACDGNDDCGDNTDEANCPTAAENVCKIDWVSCKNQQYINLAKRCDAAAKCQDGSHTTSPTPCGAPSEPSS